MHATIDFNKNIARTLRYHDLKVERGVAECIYAENFYHEAHELPLTEKLYYFNKLLYKNELSEKNILHVFLNFGFKEKLSNDKLATVGQEYIRELGYGDRPFLIYRHDDKHFMHAHIVSTIIGDNGKRQPLKLHDYYRSREITLQLEKKHSLNLSGPEDREQRQREFPLQKIKFGQMPLLTAMSKVLEEVMPTWKYTSLSEFNAILRLYNMEASLGKENSWTRKNGGLLYQPLKEPGQDEAYIKASVFKCRPTLKNLEKRFELNRPVHESNRLRFTTAIDGLLIRHSLDLGAFRKALQNQQITTILQKDKSGQPTNIWYLDARSRTVFDGAALGGRYTMAAIQQRCVSEQVYKEKQLQQENQLQQKNRHQLRL